MCVAEQTFDPEAEGSLKVHRSRSVRRPEVIPDGKNLVSHAGTALLAELADRVGLTLAMSQAMADCGISWHTHDPGVVLTHLGVAVADGADCLADLGTLKHQEALFGPQPNCGRSRSPWRQRANRSGRSRRPKVRS